MLFRFMVKALAAMALITAASAEPSVFTVLNGASYSGAVAPGSWVAIFGYDLAPAPVSASGGLGTTLGGVSVTIGASCAQLLYVSPKQINAAGTTSRPARGTSRRASHFGSSGRHRSEFRGGRSAGRSRNARERRAIG